MVNIFRSFIGFAIEIIFWFSIWSINSGIRFHGSAFHKLECCVATSCHDDIFITVPWLHCPSSKHIVYSSSPNTIDIRLLESNGLFSPVCTRFYRVADARIVLFSVVDAVPRPCSSISCPFPCPVDGHYTAIVSLLLHSSIAHWTVDIGLLCLQNCNTHIRYSIACIVKKTTGYQKMQQQT